MLNFNEFKLNEKRSFFDTNSIIEGDFHQAILDVGYDAWQSKEVNSYYDMVEMIKEEYGDKFALLILLGKYNQQVGNGGHQQYFDNGYASADDRGYGDHSDIELHDDMTELFRKTEELYNTTEGKGIYDIMVEFGEIFEDVIDDKSCEECDDDDEVEEDCYEEGEINFAKIYGKQINNLDYKYYDIVDKWEDILNDFAKKIIKEKYPVDFESLPARIKASKYNL